MDGVQQNDSLADGQAGPATAAALAADPEEGPPKHGGQTFSVSRASGAVWVDGLRPYFEYRDLGINAATNGGCSHPNDC